MRLYILYCVLVLAVLQYSPSVDAAKVKFGILCSGTLQNRFRGCDDYGCGGYGAVKKKMNGVRLIHRALDIVCNDGATIYAPVDVKLNGKAVPQQWYTALSDGINLEGEGLCFRLLYVKPDRYSGTLKRGQRIGTLLPMQKVYPGITSHVHVQMCDKSDPSKYF